MKKKACFSLKIKKNCAIIKKDPKTQERRKTVDNFNMKIKNYQYNDFDLKRIENKLETLVRRVPQSAKVHLDIEYQHNVFKGKLTVTGERKKYFASCEDHILANLISSLNRKLLRQVKKVKKNRSYEDITAYVAGF